jgi:tape measure domain-containing protein
MAIASSNDQSNILNISTSEVSDDANSIAILSSVINTCTKGFTNFSTTVIDLSLNLNNLSIDFIDLSTDLSNLSLRTVDLSSDFNSLSSKFTANIDDISAGISGLTNKFTGFASELTDLPTNISKMSKAESKIKIVSDSINQMNNKLKDTEVSTKKASTVFNKLDKLDKLVKYAKMAKSAISTLGFDKIKSGADMADKYINTSNSLSRINEEGQDQLQLLNNVNAAATRSSATYNDMANAVSKVGSLDTFGSNDETIAFTELMQKTLKVEGSDQSITDVAGSMADGVLQEDEFNSLIESAPMIGEALSDSTGKSSKQLQEMAKQGLITADLLKNSMFAAGNEIDSKFAEQPKTFADIWTQITNSASKALNPIMELVSNIINSNEFQGALNLIITALGWISQLAGSLVDFIMNNGDLIKSLLFAVGAVIIGVLAASAISWFMMYLPILLIIAAITLVILIITQLGVSFQEIFSFIGGLIGTFAVFFYNIFIGFWNHVAAFINFFGNAFNNPVASAIALFFNLATNVLGFIEKIATGIETLLNKIPGVELDLTSNISDLKDEFARESANIKDEAGLTEFVKTKDYMDYSDGATKGSEMGMEAYNKIKKGSNIITGGDYSKYIDPPTTNDPIPVEGTGPNGSVPVDMEDEDLGYLRDMAERDYIANVASNTLAPNITVSFGDVHETADVDQMFGRIRTILREQIAIAPEGVY